MLTVEKEDYTAKLIALETSPMTQCVIFKIEQSRENHRTSREKPALPKSWSLPAFPGSTLEFSARDDDRKSAIAVYTAKNTAEAAQSFFEKTLVSDGWACLHPSSASSSLRMYSKRENICCVSTTDLKGNMSSVLLLHKEDGAQP